ncbi:GIN domain-containing protein [Pontibacter rugosus]
MAGVSAGLANYLSVDPLWIRLFFVLLVLLGVVSAGVSAATGIIIYVVLWIAMPENAFLPETKVRKLFRDPEDKKLAGVSSGIAKYFGIDVAVVRLLFLLSIFLGGFGIVAYIVLWVAMPEAVTLTERMQMQGDPVTLAGIERTLKDNLNMKDSNGEESTLAKLILLPIRLISQIISWLGRALGPILAFLVTLVRVAAGVILLIISIGLTFGLISALFVSLGLIEESQYISFSPSDFPASVLLRGFPRLGLVAGFFVVLIPLLLLIVLGVSLLIKRTFLKPIVGWSLFGVWLVGLFIMIASIATYSNNFRRTGEVVTTKTIPVSETGTLVLDAYDTNVDWSNIYIEVQESNTPDVQVVQRAEAKGQTEEEAKQNTKMITYRMVNQDSTIRFDNSFEFKKGAIFRDQELSLVLKLPRNKPLRLTREFIYLLPGSALEGNYDHDKIERNTWQVNGNRLACLTCATDTLGTEGQSDYQNDSDFKMDIDIDDENSSLKISGSALLNDNKYSTNRRTMNYGNFNRISISGPYHVQLKQGEYSVVVRADNDEMERIEFDLNGDELEITTEEKYFRLFEDRKPVLIQITAPNLSTIDLSGAIKADIIGFTSDKLRMNFSGAIQTVANLNVRDLRVDASGATVSKFTGKADRFELDATGACGIDANQLEAAYVDVDVTGAGVAEVFATSTLRADATGASRITYRGNPSDTVINSSGPSSVKRQQN